MRKKYQLVIDLEAEISGEIPNAGILDSETVKLSREIYDEFIKDEEAINEYLKIYASWFLMNASREALHIYNFLKIKDVKDILPTVALRVSPEAFQYAGAIFNPDLYKPDFRATLGLRKALITGNLQMIQIVGAKINLAE